MGRKKLPFFEKVEISDVGAEGKAIARINDMVTFVSMVAPGDIVDLQVTRKRKNYAEARVTHIHKLSDNRVTPACEHFGVCGGCKWQHLPYSEQIRYKEKQVSDTLKRIGKLDFPEVSPIIGSANEYFYRNKLEFTFSNRRWYTSQELRDSGDFKNWNALGFHVPGMYDKVVDIKKCWLQEEPSNAIRNFLRNYAEVNNLEFYDTRDSGGFLRNLIIRTTTRGEVMVVLVFYREEEKIRNEMLEALSKEFPGITSLMYSINQKANDTLYDQEIIVYKGRDYIIEELEGLQFRIGPKSFFQTNSVQSLELYKAAREFAGLSGSEIVYDLYTGAGTIANFVARKAKKVIGIESVPEAIEDARINSDFNGIKNTEFFAGDMKDMLTAEFIMQHGKPDVVITDPPRAGMHESVVQTLIDIAADCIVYISCNPATQARDLQLMSSFYRIEKVQPVDMFPHTHHVENIIKLQRIIQG
ncbi:MAG: 23S rRNA (uracil(1939)-C(5))-methyltransferase RlmD [Bacteroidales bacterium]|nr:23S rRNA (uracil(1939)-C(5))-methyltransferase RlmD [Bacteroidales bacterium]